jgi:hypothetical protein
MISKADAKELARAECGRRGLPFAEPVLVSRRGLRRYSVWTDGRMRGGNVSLSVDRRTGAVEFYGVAAR